MDAITAAVQAHIQNQVAIMKEGIDRLTLSLNEREKNLADALKREKKLIVDVAKARSAAVGWRKRCDEMEIRAICAEGEYNCEKSEAEDLVKEWANLEENLLQRAEKAEAESKALLARALNAEIKLTQETEWTEELSTGEKKAIARAEKAETALTEALKKLDAAYQRGVDDGLDLAKVAADAEKMPKAVEGEGCSSKPAVTVFNGINYPTVSKAGPDIATLKGVSYEEALAKALELKCIVMIKKLNGDTWYLKGQGMDFVTVKKNIEFLSKRTLESGSQTRTIYLIEH